MVNMKTQVSADFLIALTVALVMFLFLFAIIGDRSRQFDTERTRLHAKELADRVSADINAIYLAGPGTTKTIELPNSLKDESLYVVNIYSEARVVEVIWRIKDVFHYYGAPIVSCLDDNLTNIIDDITITGGGECISLTPFQTTFDINSFCIELGYSSGMCTQGASECVSMGGVHEPKGGSFCIREVSGVGCCVP